ncbi:uncharacterized protein LOC110686760 [Chenopodium quinoa]|uniref:uncharacterized protein LOC110686760 n=1 Tax=Chenopodium quinoa TaxID=63459 RepID=UPI000B771F47|nr:uncharacterized protein LOC110686760 [Chenopodium quinoa]
MEQPFDQDFFGIEQLLQEGQYEANAQDNNSYEASQGNNNAEEEEGHVHPTSRKQLTVTKKRQLIDEFLMKMNQGQLPRGLLSAVAKQHGIHRSTATRVWQFVQDSIAKGNFINVRSKKLGKKGRQPKFISDEELQSVPLYKRVTERSYAAALKVSHGFIHNLKKKGRLRTHSATNHPALTSNHKLARLKWALAHIHPIPQVGNPTFIDMQQVIHIDEKWFYMNPETRQFYLLSKEENPYMCQQSKRYKIKAMFMAMIGKPLHDLNGNMLHDGKYGIFPFTYQQLAKKKS